MLMQLPTQLFTKHLFLFWHGENKPFWNKHSPWNSAVLHLTPLPADRLHDENAPSQFRHPSCSASEESLDSQPYNHLQSHLCRLKIRAAMVKFHLCASESWRPDTAGFGCLKIQHPSTLRGRHTLSCYLPLANQAVQSLNDLNQSHKAPKLQSLHSQQGCHPST